MTRIRKYTPSEPIPALGNRSLEQIRDEGGSALEERLARSIQHKTVTAHDPILQTLSDDDLELLDLLLNDYYAFVTFGLGNRVEDYPGFADPGVVEYIDRYGAILNDWRATRYRQKTFRKVMVIVPRECCKSTLITQAAPIYLHAGDPDIAMFISSATMDAKPSAAEFAAGAAKHWEGRNSHAILPDFYGDLTGPTWRQNRYITKLRLNETRRDPTLGVFSVQTGGTSGHFNAGWLDDPITYEQLNRYGENWNAACWTHYLSLGYVVRQDGILTVVMTRYGATDLCGQIIDVEIAPEVRRRALPGAPEGVLPSDFRTRWHKYAHLANWDVINMSAEYDEDTGEHRIMFPVIWPQERIDAERLKSPATVASQLNNRPGVGEEHPIRPHHIERSYIESLDDVPEPAFTYLTLQCDLAIKSSQAKKEGRGDFTVLQLWAHHLGHVYLVWSWRGRPTQEEFDDRLIEAFRFAQGPRCRSRIRIVTYDKPVGLGSGASYAKEHFEFVLAEAGLRVPRIIELSRSGKRKIEDRILQTAPFWVGGLIHMLRDTPCAPEIAAQVLNPYSVTHDDDADAMADVFHEKVYTRKVRRQNDQEDPRKSLLYSQGAISGRYDPKTGAFAPIHRVGGSRLTFGGGRQW